MTVISRADLDRQMIAIDRFRDGFTMHQIAHELQVTPRTVDTWLTDWGIIRRCNDCGIILETQEDEFCCVCAKRRAGHRWACGLPLGAQEAEPVNLGEVFTYGR